ncbi:phage protein NinX family protein [Morganella morganii]|uniref:phage protein NinX family protein n=1 Tax=Morganella morganii TaxID=582 RepID=UPI003EBB2712
MNKYRDKSDFEINKAVAEHRKLNAIAYDLVEIVLFDDMDATPFDPCNDPADAMPIVIDNEICMNYIDKDIGWGARHFDEEKGELEIYDKHYYRAAMICFLMMKEAENEKQPPMRNM